MNDNMRTNYQYYIENKDELYKEFPDLYLVIKDSQVIGTYDDQVTAYTETTKSHEPGTFIIQLSSPDATDTQVFHTRVVKVL